jgi:hypothetical protein
MTFIREYYEIIVIVLFIAAFVLLALILSMNRYFAMYFSNKRFKIISSYEVNANDGNKYFSIAIYNNNINEVRLSGFGYVYQDQNIDFYKNYLIDHSLPSDHKLVIHSRDFLTTRIDVNQLKTIISDINKGTLDVKGMKTFVTDSLGLSTTAKAKQVQDQLYVMLKVDQATLRNKQREQLRKHREEVKLFKKKQKIERNIRIKEKTNGMILKVKGFFNFRRPKA